MTISPAFRRLQQNPLIQTIVVPALITGVAAAVAAILAASHGDLSTLTHGALTTALGVGGAASLTYILGIYQHGLGSASFHADGSPNKMVDKVAAQTAAIPQARADQLDVKVVSK
jgi:hypothetical protein